VTPEARRQIEATIAHLQALLDADCDCPEATTVTVRELWDRYVETLPDKLWVRQMKSHMKNLITRVGDVQAAKLKVSHVEDWRDDQKTKERYQGSTMRIQISRLRSCFTWAVDSGRIAANPLSRMKLPRTKPKRETEISPDGEMALLERFDERMKAFFLVAIDSGMRRDEIRLLEWSDVDEKARRLTIPAARTKTHKARTGRITTRALEAVQALPRVPGCPFVFASPRTRRPLSKSWVWENWRVAADDAGLKPAGDDESVRLHDTRATTISRMVRLGASIPAIQVIVGHSSLQTTERYIRVQSEDVDAAHELLEAHLQIAAFQQRKGPQRATSSAQNAAVEAMAARGA
jgi:integrase